MSPTTTGGNPIRALSKILTTVRPGNRHTATAAPSGKPSTVARPTAARLTAIDRRTMATKSRSRPIMRLKAVKKAARKSSTACQLHDLQQRLPAEVHLHDLLFA